ncbi:MAG: OsmC family protein [Longimicrobiales bacterium]
MSGNIRQARLRWTGKGMAFRGGPDGGAEIGVDGDGVEGPAPMHLLLMSVGACMAIDVLMILEKGRVPVNDLEIETIGVRADDHPRRYESIELVYRISGPAEDDEVKIDRAIELSKDKYCSVLHTLDPTIDLAIRSERV